MRKHPDVVVIGAGVFGSCTAWHLLERGARVTLVDAWGAGHPRGTSSGETRVIRCGYGLKPIYTDWGWRSLKLWKRWQREWQAELFVNSGVLWLCAREDDYVRASTAALRKRSIPHQRLSSREIARRFPQMNPAGIRFGYFEPQSGFLRARLATMHLARVVARHPRGRVLLASSLPPAARHQSQRLLKAVLLADRVPLRADYFVFACGPWLPQIFPQVLSRRIRVTKQEVFFFGVPAGDSRFAPPALPVWVDIHRDFYGVPACDGRGFKVACDRPGALFNPTEGERAPDPRHLRAARRYLAYRFPALAGVPLVETRICQYERTPDSHLVIDRHPDFANVWLAGGGSGHGFKLGPAVGEFIARQLLEPGRVAVPPEMRLGASAWPKSGPLPVTRSF